MAVFIILVCINVTVGFFLYAVMQFQHGTLIRRIKNYEEIVVTLKMQVAALHAQFYTQEDHA